MTLTSPESAALLTERLIEAAVDYERAEGIYSRPARQELSEARAAVEAAITAGLAQCSQEAGLVREITRLRAGLQKIVDFKNPLPRSVVREACAELLAAAPWLSSTDRPDGYRDAWLQMIAHCNEVKADRFRLEQTIRDSIEALERNSTSAPVVECLKAALPVTSPEGKSQ